MEGLAVRPDGIYVDGTAGGGGHAAAIAEQLTTGRLVAIDRDTAAVKAASMRLAPFGERAVVVHANYVELDAVLDRLGIDKIDGFLLDLGVSSYQLDTPERGFSYQFDAPLDMRMDRGTEKTAYTVVNTYSEEAIKNILYLYGEERFAPRIAKKIVAEREKSPVETTGQLAEIIKSAIPAAAREGGHHPAKRSFQAIRIEVNGELDVIAPALTSAVARMRQGGRLVVITFHSLEDRLVKQTLATLSAGCTCPKTLPVCICGKKPQVRLITKKPVLPGEAELNENPRSRSAKLRVAEKI